MSTSKLAHLNWVRGPIERYIERAKQAMINIASLRERIENPPVGAEPTWFRNQHDKLEENREELSRLLRTVHSALNIISSDGGSRLASELVTLVSVSSEMTFAEETQALLSIQNCLQVLPSYLGMVIDGAHDSPGVLLKYINELRAHRSVPELADSSALLVNISFSYQSPPLYEPDCEIADRENVFKKAASEFCGLYTKFMEVGGVGPWMEMREHLRELQRVTNDPELGSYWWVGEGIVDVIIVDKGFVPPAMTTALRVIMVATQRLPSGEDAARQSLSAAKFASLLNALSISRKKTDTSTAVISAFNIKQNVEEDRISELQEKLASQSVQSLVDVLPEIEPRLEAAMIAFGRAAVAKKPEGFVVQKNAFDQAMRTMANIFGIFNEPDLSEVSFHIADVIKGIESKDELTADVIETVKTQILYLDSKLTQLRRNEVADLLQFTNVTPDVIEKLVNESTAELNRISRALATHIDSGVGSEKLLVALGTLRELASVYEFAGSHTIGNILSAIVSVFTAEIESGVLVESERLIQAARALVAVEMYIHFISDGLQPPASLIEAARTAVHALGFDTSEFAAISHTDLLSKFEQQEDINSGIDPLLREIFDVRPQIEELLHLGVVTKPAVLNAFASACLLLSAAAQIKNEQRFAELCRHASDLAKCIPGRVDNTDFDHKQAAALALRSCEMILRCMDEYSSRGKVNLFLIDILEELALTTGSSFGIAGEANSEAAVEPAESRAVRELPDGYDSKLHELFTEEFAEQVEKLFAYVANSDLSVTEVECRAIHNIHGCAASANCIAISTLFDVLEARFYALKATESALTVDQAKELSGLLGEVVEYKANFPWQKNIDVLPMWIDVAGRMTGVEEPVLSTQYAHEPVTETQNAPATFETMVEPVAQTAVAELVEPVAEPVALEIVEPVTEPAALEIVEPVTEQVEYVAPVLPAPESSKQTDVESKFTLDADYDQGDMLDLYVGDAEDVLPELQQNISEWLSNMQDRSLSVKIRRNMHTLKGAAALIQADGFRDLTHHMESLFDAISSGSIHADVQCACLTELVMKELITMNADITAREPYRVCPALNEFIEEACELSSVSAEKLNDIRDLLDSISYPQFNNLQPVVAHVAQPAPVIAEVVVTPEPEVAAAVNTIAESVASTEIESAGTNPRSSLEPEVGEHETGSEQSTGTRRGTRAGNSRPHNSKKADEQKVPKSFFMPAPPIPVVEPELTVIQTEPKPMSSLLVNFIEGVSNVEKPSQKTGAPNPKIKVEIARIDSAMQLANELKAASYRQNNLHREAQHSITALREKMTLLLMHSNKTTVQLRYFNNYSSPALQEETGNHLSEEAQNHLERFNHLSHSHTQQVLQIQQALQDTQDILTQMTLLENSFNYQAEVVSSLHSGLAQARMVRFLNERPNIFGAAEIGNKDSNKNAKPVILGGDTQIDRLVLEHVRNPLRHIVTNAVIHGIESESERLASGKPEQGTITVKATRQAKSAVIEITDDGRGMNRDQIFKKAVELKIISPDEVLDDREILNLVTRPGFTTAKLSSAAGRGMGMNIVAAELAKIGGKLSISSTVGQGTTFTIELPQTIGSNRALLSRVGGQWFAVPIFNMAQVLDYPTTELMAIRAKPGQSQIVHDAKSYDLVHLADLIGVPDLKTNSAQVPSHVCLVLIEREGTRLAIEVGSDVSMPDIHTSKFDGIMGSITGIIGSTEVHDGSPALVIDVIELSRVNLTKTAKGYESKLYRIRRVKREARPLVLIVDDSSSYQKLLSNHFLSMGLEVALAQNGQDALDKLHKLPQPALFVVDVEMPRMNGLELTEALRKQKQFDQTPIVMLTTKGNLEEAAMKLGVNKFLSKPYNAAALSEAVNAVCPQFTSANSDKNSSAGAA